AVGIEAGWIRPFLAGLLMLLVILFLPGGLASLLPRRNRPVTDDGAEQGVLTAARDYPSPGEPLVTLTGLGKDYGGVHANKDIDLEITSGEVLGLIGPNGAGKT